MSVMAEAIPRNEYRPKAEPLAWHVVALEEEKEQEAIVREKLRPAVLEVCVIWRDHRDEDHITLYQE